MTNEEFVRYAYGRAEVKDIQGWIDCFTPDGVFVDNSVEVTYTGPEELAKPVEYYGAAFSDMHRELYDIYVSGEVVVVQLALQGTHDGALHLPFGMLPPTGNPLADHLITPQNSAFLLIDWQPTQISTVRSMDQDLLLRNAVSTVRTVKAYGVPVVHSTVNVASGQQQPTVPELAELVQDDDPIDRTTMNSWEAIQFVHAVRATGRRKLILCALWTEICMAFVALDALREGYEVYPVVDAIGGTSLEAHRAGLERSVQAGAQPISWVSLAGELQRDWGRQETVPALVEIVLTDRLLKESAEVGAPV
jgi:nicotinamidase-related amidase